MADVRYVGLSLQDARVALAETAKAGPGKSNQQMHDAIANLSKSLEAPELRQASHYVVCWSSGCVIKVD